MISSPNPSPFSPFNGGLRHIAVMMVGALAGGGLFTFHTAKGTAYLSNDPQVCVGCHIMRAEYDGWQHSSHHTVAVCNDCHLPHESVAAKLMVKALNGWHHSRAFTLQDFQEPIRIKPGNAKVLEDNCIACHTGMVETITAHGTLGTPTDPEQGADLYGCVRCHAAVGHGPTR